MKQPMTRLEDKVIVVLSNSYEIAQNVKGSLTELGASVILIQSKYQDESFSNVSYSRDDLLFSGKLTVDTSEKIVTEIQHLYGSVDALINFSDFFFSASTLTIAQKDLRLIFDINLHSVFNLSQAFAKNAIKYSFPTSIVHLTSIFAEHTAASGIALYAASKAALNSLAKTQALEWGRYGIRVNCIASSLAHNNSSYSYSEFLRSRTPLLQPTISDLGKAAAFFVSSESANITGQILTVDGGFTANGSWQ
jgi:NAD(P)-dependent dehydrogenase (short-subunit alcohol dehydrogenase family)